MFLVHYGSAGCLPDSTMEFQSIAEAREFIRDEWETIARECIEWFDVDHEGKPLILSRAAYQAMSAIQSIGVDGRVDDPRPGSLYRWTIEEVQKVGNAHIPDQSI